MHIGVHSRQPSGSGPCGGGQSGGQTGGGPPAAPVDLVTRPERPRPGTPPSELGPGR